MSQATRRAIDWVEQGLIPDAVVRAADQALLQAKRGQEPGGGGAAQSAHPGARHRGARRVCNRALGDRRLKRRRRGEKGYRRQR